MEKFRQLNKIHMIILAILAIMAFSPCSPAMASETGHDTHESTEESGHSAEAGEGHGADRSADLKDLLYRFINFGLLVIILGWAIKKVNVKALFAARTKEIRERLEQLKKDKEESETKYREIERKLRDFEAQRVDIIEDFKKEGLAEKERIIAEAKTKADQILEQAEITIAQELQVAKDCLKQEVVDLAAQKAGEIIANSITEQDQDNLVDDFIERVGKVH